MEVWTTTCLVAGGGPAGMMLGYLLARSGVSTLVVERHGDFFRDFRGDTVHPSTTELMHELGILDEFLCQVPHQVREQLGIGFKGQTFDLVDFRHLPTVCKYVAFMPQWDFLTFLADKAKRYRSFRLEMNTEVTGLLWDGDRVAGVTAQTPGGPVEIHADLIVGCDGRSSVIREQSGLPITEFPMPIDVLWFRLPRNESAPESLGFIGDGQIIIAINRGDYWQCGDNHRKRRLRTGEGRGPCRVPVDGRRGRPVPRHQPQRADRLGPSHAALGTCQPVTTVVATGLVVYRRRRARDVAGRRYRS